ncbi:ribonuclease HI family protein [Chryseomicrobium sp. FSL W7-1435]|uniref:ribonuclease HI family protein n=1 Tax=Chryseomicrobium sp. FSL W7-1435 TaxID=2921704 RepID=UPI003159BA67
MIELYTDAATRGNPGESAIGVYWKGNGEVGMYATKIGSYSNHEAEFIALRDGIQQILSLKPDILSIRVDSKIVYDAVDRGFVKNPVFKVYLAEIESLLAPIPMYFIKWIPEKENKAAHRLATDKLRE